ncbi:hypothetical protein B9J87_10225 [Vibrio sp. V19_P1S1T109]|nr:hypothetical protein [Vibrio anguillarum]OXX33971.1 hypothetical protein B9J95_04585 [Vibrio sp. V14_P6S14T42]OXX61481.1 hypothetical protein B9J89_15200 [Vibrio sp. V15_P4S5T153]OXX71576.1 hypothetical protein B9J87_10225 [Vibrio sp. V19_P1S1T109]PSD42402.1 hypothetical protein C7E22_05965 [Vibrio sp. V02_P2A34T13]
MCLLNNECAITCLPSVWFALATSLCEILLKKKPPKIGGFNNVQNRKTKQLTRPAPGVMDGVDGECCGSFSAPFRQIAKDYTDKKHAGNTLWKISRKWIFMRN